MHHSSGGGSGVHSRRDEGPSVLSNTRRLDGWRAIDVMTSLQEQLAILSGGRDRRGGPILFFPATPRREKAKPEDYRNLLQYLLGIPADDIRELCFTVVIDMRGSTWTTVKPILKVLQESFSSHISTAHIIKPDNFWQKQRTSLGSQKYKFETNLIGVDSLLKYIDASQLTSDLEGLLHYDHKIWIELRVALEDFIWQSSELLDRFEDLKEDLNHNDFADDVSGAKKGMEQHNELRKKIIGIPVESVDSLGQCLLHRLSSCEGGQSYDSGYSGRDSTSSNMTGNPDMQSSIPSIMGLLDQVHTGQSTLLHLWQIKKVKLDQCLQLRLFEQDCEKMFDWIHCNRNAFLHNYVDIGNSYVTAKKLQEDHSRFALTSNTVYSDVNGILGEASKLIDSNHYATLHVRNVASRLDKTWKIFSEGLEERSTVLSLSVLYHQKAEQYLENVPKWSKASELGVVSTDIPNLESNIHHHQSLYETMCQAYTEVHSNSKKLLYKLDHLVVISNQKTTEESTRKHIPGCPYTKKLVNSKVKEVTSDYSEGASHVLSVIHDILSHHRSLEVKWHAKKIKLHQRLALRLFQEDVKQVLDWLQNHGEVFLRKNIGVGRSLAKARAYQKSHETFEGVVQNTYTNAEKLLAAAAELAQTGECNAEDIYSVAHELESHISGFAERVGARRRLLELSVLFYSHTEELSNWLTELRIELTSEEVSESLEGAERLIEQFSTQRESTLDAIANTISEGKSLIEELKLSGRARGETEGDSNGSLTSIGSTLEYLQSQEEELEKLWRTRKLRLELCHALRFFERETIDLSSQFEIWTEKLVSEAQEPFRDLKETENQLRSLTDYMNHIQNATLKVNQRGHDLLQQFESSNINIMSDGVYSGTMRVEVLLEYIREREMDIEECGELRRLKLEQSIQLWQFKSDANQVNRWIHSAEGMLTAGFSVPASLRDAEMLKKEHEQFQTAIEKTHASAVHVRRRAETLLNNQHFDSQSIKDIADEVTTRWQLLVTHAEERHKLVTASLNFYKTAEQVCSVMDSLEREYRREDDWLSRSSYNEKSDRVTILTALITKHTEQKEAFLKACTLARRTAETFLKYYNRSLTYFKIDGESNKTTKEFRGPEFEVKTILEKLLHQENRVLEYWTSKKKRLDQNQQFCLFERSAKQSLEWIKEEGDSYLNTHTSVGSNKEENEFLLQEHNSFKEKAKETREKVKLLLQLAEALVQKGHAHAPTIKNWVSEVDETYKDFSRRMDEYRLKLTESLGTQESFQSNLDRHSDPSLETKYKDIDFKNSALNGDETKRRSARRKEFIMAELLETERSYVKDLETAVNSFLKPLSNHSSTPSALWNKESLIFGNLTEILSFHKSIFLKELEKYECMPEDVGHCFVTWASQFDIYVEYCTNKPASAAFLTSILSSSSLSSYFENLQHFHHLEHSLSTYLIKPVQRITKYQLLLKDLLSSCSGSGSEIAEGLEVCLSVPKKANDALHLSLLEGFDLSKESLGDVILQDSLTTYDSKQIIKKAKERRVFLFELYLVFSKEIKDGNGKSKYLYKSRMNFTSEMGLTEHIEGDECKFAAWTGRTGTSPENKVIFKTSSLEVKQIWIKKMRELIQETYFMNITSFACSGNESKLEESSKRSSRDCEEVVECESGEYEETGKYNESKSTDVGLTWVLEDYIAVKSGEVSVHKGQQVELLSLSSGFALIKVISSNSEGHVPLGILRQSNRSSEEPLESSSSTSGSSPGGKKKVFSGKWLPNIRKLSHGKLERSHLETTKSATSSGSLHNLKTPSKNKFKLSSSTEVMMGNKGGSLSEESSLVVNKAEYEEETEVVELPPPMEPISSSVVIAENTSAPNTTNCDSNDEEEEEDPKASALRQREYRLNELYESELTYVKDLGDCVSYLTYMRNSKDDPLTNIVMPNDLRDGKDRMIFGNIEAIYEWHRDFFSKNLEKAIASPSDLGTLFTKYDRKFQMYVLYCQNKPKSEHIVSEHIESYFEELRLALGFKLRLSDLLIKPIQRLTKYHMLLEALLKYSQRSGLLEEATSISKAFILMTIIPNQANDMMDIGRLQGFEGKITAQGKLLHRGTLYCLDNLSSGTSSSNIYYNLTNTTSTTTDNNTTANPRPTTLNTTNGSNLHKMKPFSVFLFEQIVIFSEMVGKRSQFSSPVYVYVNHLLVNKMSLQEDVEDKHPCKFIIRSTDPARDSLIFHCQSEDPESRNSWISIIKKQLQTQMDFLKAIQAPIAYHNKLATEASEKEFKEHHHLASQPKPQENDDNKNFEEDENESRSKEKKNQNEVEVVVVTLGDSARLSFSEKFSQGLQWKFSDGKEEITNSLKYSLTPSSLTISNVSENDSGIYTCTNVVSGTQKTWSLKVRLLRPEVLEITGSSAILCCKSFSSSSWSTILEVSINGNDWSVYTSELGESVTNVENLIPGHSYEFRLLSNTSNFTAPSLPSTPLVVPHLSFTESWNRNFERAYIQLDEIGRGRWSIVRRCQEILSGKEKAVKFISRKKASREKGVLEYENLLKITGHRNVLTAESLFLTSSSDIAIVMPLIIGRPLFEFLCEDTSYTEASISLYMSQLLEALEYIHGKNISHLNVKPENLLMNPETQILTLIDFGSSHFGSLFSELTFPETFETMREKSSLEFLSPEMISKISGEGGDKGPLGPFCDMWSFGVLLYVSLSGLSPFLDDSDEETLLNILECDFSFPSEYFSSISKDAQDLISSTLNLNPSLRLSATVCLSSSWLLCERKQGPETYNSISSSHLSTLVQRRLKKLNSVAPLSLPSSSSIRPEGLTKKI